MSFIRSTAVSPDLKPPARVRDPELLRALHLRWRTCPLCESDDVRGALGLSLHHIHKHPRDDVEANLVMLCGDGTRGHHGLVEHHDPHAMKLLERHLRVHRPDVFTYLAGKLGGAIAADEWLRNLTRSKLNT